MPPTVTATAGNAGGNLAPTAPGLSTGSSAGNASPTAPGTSGGAAGGNLAPTAPGLSKGAAAGDAEPSAPSSALLLQAAGILFVPDFTPILPNSGTLIQVPGRTEYSRPIYTTTGTSSDALVSQELLPSGPTEGIWCAAYYDGTTWRFDLRYDGELILYYRSASSAFATPAAVPTWTFTDNPGTSPGDDWEDAPENLFGFSLTGDGCVIVPSCTPALGGETLYKLGLVNGYPYYASGDPTWDGTEWQNADSTLGWAAGGYSYEIDENVWSQSPQSISALDGYYFCSEGGGNGLIRATVALPAEPDPVTNAFAPDPPSAPGLSGASSAGNRAPTAPGASTGNAGGNLGPTAPGAIS